jgi:hypothetical protein
VAVRGNLVKERTIRQGHMQDWRCTILFMIIYFFFMAGSLWYDTMKPRRTLFS